MYLREATELHERLGAIATLPSLVSWCVLMLLMIALDLLMYVWNQLKSIKVTGSMVVPLIWDFRTSLRDALSDTQTPSPDEDEAHVLQARGMLLPWVHIFLKDFDSRWGSDVATYKEGPRY